MVDLTVASLFLNVLALALPVSLLQVYDRILPNKSQGTLFLLVVGVLVALLFEGVMRIGRSYITGWIGARFEHMAGCAALDRLLTTSLNDFEREGSGVHLERFNALATVKDFYAGQAVLTLLDLPFVVLYLALIALLGGWLVLVPTVLLIAFALSAAWIGQKLRNAVKNRMTADDRRFNFIIEVLGGIHSIKAMAMEAQMLRRYERLQESCAEGDYIVAQHSASAMGLSSFFSQLTMIAVAAAGATVVINGEMTNGGLAACTLLAGRAMQPLQRALGIWTRFQTIRIARERLSEIFRLQPEAVPGLPALPPLEGALELRNVSFRFKPDQPDVLKSVSLEIKPGECIGIAGGNGSGKSTLLAMMLGALRPTEGTVLADGNDLSQFEPDSVRRQIAYLPQQGTLFQGTILENITMFQPELSDAAIEAAATLGLDEVVATMALGYDTRVGDGAHDSMPRGIKQRIAVARALVHSPRIVLFDEANTAVDMAGDRFLSQCLENLKGKVTLVLVTHRPSMLKMADRAFNLEQGVLTPRIDAGPSQPPRPAAAQAAETRKEVSA